MHVCIPTTVKSAVFLAAALAASAAAAGDDHADARYMPPNVDKIATALVQRGVIRANATPAEREAAVDAYLAARLKGGEPQGNPRARKLVDANVAKLDAFTSSDVKGRKLGNTKTVSPSIPAYKPLESTGKLLVILLDFRDVPFPWTGLDGKPKTAQGPLHNQIPRPDNDYDLWVPDFSPQHYRDMLFTPGGFTFPPGTPYYAGQRRGSMTDFYRVQSFGRYTVTGQTYGWYTLDKPEAFYGENQPSSGSDARVRSHLIPDAVAAVNAAGPFDWAAYDTDGDCIVDHALFIHAGIDESGGGGAQGEGAIWAHSSAVPVSTKAACADGRNEIWVYNYTIMPEDGGVGVFAHEFGHDLGLPDEYDTIYSGRGDGVANWSIMSQGSWLGRPAQTQPSDMSIWARLALGWVTDNLATTNLDALRSGGPVSLRLDQSSRWAGAGSLNAVRINLPKKRNDVNVPHGGAWEWFGGKADEIDTTLARTVDLTGKTSATLSFWTWYDIETQWDFGFVQVSTDGGTTWASLPIAGTTSLHDTDAMPEIVAQLPGFTGRSGGWVSKTADLSAYAGRVVKLQFRYMTDWGTTGAGFYVDDVSVVANGATVFSDGAETLDPAWAADGWTRDQGYSLANHYYLAEWRNTASWDTSYDPIVNFDAGLQVAAQGDAYSATPTQPRYYAYSPGLVLWYRDTSYTDNWTGVHPGHGYLLPVDAHDQVFLRPPAPGLGAVPYNTHVQSSDAAFSLNRTIPLDIGYWGVLQVEQSQNAMPAFDDGHTYWSSSMPEAGVITPRYGIVLRVLGQASDMSAAAVGIGTK